MVPEAPGWGLLAVAPREAGARGGLQVQHLVEDSALGALGEGVSMAACAADISSVSGFAAQGGHVFLILRPPLLILLTGERLLHTLFSPSYRGLISIPSRTPPAEEASHWNSSMCVCVRVHARVCL